MAKNEFGYVGRVRGCGCVVMVTADNPQHADATADALAEAIRDGLVVERHPIEAVRAMPFGKACGACAREPAPMRGERSLYRAERVVYVAARDEDEARDVARDAFATSDFFDDHAIAKLYSGCSVPGDAEVYDNDCGDDRGDAMTFEEWASAPLTEEEQARAYRKLAEAAGQQRLPEVG